MSCIGATEGHAMLLRHRKAGIRQCPLLAHSTHIGMASHSGHPNHSGRYTLPSAYSYITDLIIPVKQNPLNKKRDDQIVPFYLLDKPDA